MTSLTRSYASLFKQGLEGGYNTGLSYFANNSYNYPFIVQGQKDTRFDIATLTQICMNEPAWFGAFTKIHNMVNVSGWEIYEVKKNGNLVISRPAREYKRLLEAVGQKDIRSNMLAAAYGLGMGGGVAYKVKEKGQTKVKFDPYVLDGLARIAFYGNNASTNPDEQVQAVEILGSRGQQIHKFNAKDTYHYQFLNPNTSKTFGSNGLLAAAKVIMLRYHMNQAMDNQYVNGMQAKYLVSLDASKYQKMGGSPTDIIQANRILEERLKQGTGVQNAGAMLYTPYALSFQNIQMNASEMRSIEHFKELRDEIFFALGFDPVILQTKDGKYDNAEQAKDLLYQDLQSFFIDEQSLTEKFTLPQIDPEFDNTRFIYRIPRQFTEEQVKIMEAKQREMQYYFSNLKTANEALSGNGLVALPDENGLKWLQEQKIYIKTIGKEDIDIKPSTDNQVADSFTKLTHGESVQRQISQDEVDEVYSKYQETVNMSASELEAWADNECSQNASLDRSPIERNLKLLRTPKSEWGQNEVTQANRTISFVSRMKGAEQGEKTQTDSGRTCPSKRDISLKNWAYDPNKSRSVDFYENVKNKLDKSFQSILSV